MLTKQDLRAYCNTFMEAEETFPFGENVLVFKVVGKMFALIPLDDEPASISLKCDPQLAMVLRQTYPAVSPGYHLNKRHWNTVVSDGTIPDDEIYEMIDNSYHLVVKGLPKKDRERLLNE
ncbi:MAG: MmcQ/YjbR family DNA-binding protein [Phototrophicales bacterium]|nr:MAG: MmcQ-like protein [Phototrophicales bacterium]RMG75201.1 MAG: MmcQ/YjbR family DNA-binding protein [Chloroflexota bacterium]